MAESNTPEMRKETIASIMTDLSLLKNEVAVLNSTAKRALDDASRNKVKLDSHDERLNRIEQILEILCKNANVTMPEATKPKTTTKNIPKRAPSEFPATETTTTTDTQKPIEQAVAKPKAKAKASSGIANNLYMYMNMNMSEARIANNKDLQTLFNKMVTRLTDEEKNTHKSHGQKVRFFHNKIDEAHKKKIANSLNTNDANEVFYNAVYDILYSMFRSQNVPVAVETPAEPATIEVSSPRNT